MLEIVVVYLLARKIGGIVEAKGQSGTGYKWLTAGLWFGGEILGFIIGFAAIGPRGEVLAAYPFGLAGAVGGVAIAWVLASQVPVNPIRAWNPTHLTPPSGAPAWAQPNPALPPVMMIPGNVELVLEQRAGDWAQVRAANGFAGFVDARLLIPRPGSSPWTGGSAWTGQR
jgi:hypothetical protein